MRLVLHDYGGYAFTLQLAEYLARNGCCVFYIHGGTMQAVQRAKVNSPNLQLPELKIDTVQISRPFAKYSFIRRWFQEREYARLLVQKIRCIDPDIVISSTSPLDVQNALQKYTRKHGKKFIFWWQDITGLATQKILSQKNSLLGFVVGSYYKSLERNLLRHSDKVIAIADEFSAQYQTWGLAEEKFSIIPNWAPLEEIPLLPKDNPWSRVHGFNDKFVFLYTGILGLKHNPGIFLTLADYFQDDPLVQIVVVSQGLGADWLKNQEVRPNLHLFPFQAVEDYPAVLASGDVLVAAIEDHAGAYSVPSKTLTYLCAGRPTLLSAPLENQAARLLASIKGGLAVPPLRDDLLCQAAGRLRQNSDLCITMGNNSRLYALENFKIDRIGAAFREILLSG